MEFMDRPQSYPQGIPGKNRLVHAIEQPTGKQNGQLMGVRSSNPRHHACKGGGCRRMQPLPHRKEQSMELGAFSISLVVKDIEASRKFYEKFGFKVFAGDASQNWLILKNGDHAIGLFQGMFEKNILTFNPGWDSNAQKLATFTDVRDHAAPAKGPRIAVAARGGREHDGAG